MKFFVDNADIGEIQRPVEAGLLEGGSVSPSLSVTADRNLIAVIARTCGHEPGPEGAQFNASDVETRLSEAGWLLIPPTMP